MEPKRIKLKGVSDASITVSNIGTSELLVRVNQKLDRCSVFLRIEEVKELRDYLNEILKEP